MIDHTYKYRHSQVHVALDIRSCFPGMVSFALQSPATKRGHLTEDALLQRGEALPGGDSSSNRAQTASRHTLLRPPVIVGGMWTLQRLTPCGFQAMKGTGKMCVCFKSDGFQFSRTKNPDFRNCSPLSLSTTECHSWEGGIKVLPLGHSLNSGAGH